MATRRFAPPPRKPAVPPRPVQGAAVNWLGWKKPYDAIEEFLAACGSATIDLAGFPHAEECLSWLNEAVHQTDEYVQWLRKCSDDLDAAVNCSDQLREEGESVKNLLSLLSGVDENILLRLEEDGVSENLKNTLSEFLDERIQSIRQAGWDMYHVLIRAA